MKRNPNGFGTVSKLSGSRAKPYVAYMPAKVVKGKRKRDPIGYFETEIEARMALAEWNKTQGTKINYSLDDLYQEWSKKSYEKISRSTADCYRAAWNYMEPLHDSKVRVIRTGHFQDIVDSMSENGKSYSTMHNVKVLAGLLEKYAMQYDIILKNYAEYIEIPKIEVEEKEPFTEEQVKALEEAAVNNFMASRLILILVYTGWRINEFLNLTDKDYDPELKAFTGGLKTDYGKDRVVPVHSTVQPYVDELLQRGTVKLVTYEKQQGRGNNKSTVRLPCSDRKFRNDFFKPTLDALNIKKSDGTDFTPHATRHTFATLGHQYGVEPLVLKKLLGHSPGKGVTEKVYIHINNQQLRDGIEKIRPREDKDSATPEQK